MARVSRKTTLAGLAGIVSEKLKEKGLSAILVGGAVVSLYSENRYESGDLDFVIESFVVRKGLVEDAMAELGFRRDRSRVYLHPHCRYAIDFSPPPVAIGEEVVTDPGELKTSTGKVRLLTPTQSVMDRLAAYYHFGDLQGLEQALLVAERHPVDLKKAKAWSAREGHAREYGEFDRRLRSRPR